MESVSFTSFQFIAIALITFLLYWSVRSDIRRNIILILGCYGFYSMASIRMAGLLLAMSVITYLTGIIIARNEWNSRGRIFLTIGIIFDLGILLVFKYLDFFITNVAYLLSTFGFRVSTGTVRLLMPAGLSFYTFMLISHLIDCKRGIFRNKDVKFSTFIACICFFPHLIAGPIDRSRLLMQQLDSDKSFRFDTARQGLWQILNGLVKKFVVADTCAVAVNTVWSGISSYSSLTLIITAIIYSMQIYFDFSAFSDMAIGVGKLFGLRLMENFNYPYFSRNISEFWRKWHMSLTSWFTEYIYIPLGGSRINKLRTCINTLIVFGLCGLWHGANWGYVAWGLICGALFIPYLMQRHPGKYKGQPSFTVRDMSKLGVTFICISMTWIIFRGAQTDISYTTHYLSQLFACNFEYQAVPYMLRALIYSLIFILFEWTQRHREFALAVLKDLSISLRWITYIILTVIIYVVYITSPLEESADTFIYQNF